MQLPRKYHNRVLYALERTKALRSGEIDADPRWLQCIDRVLADVPDEGMRAFFDQFFQEGLSCDDIQANLFFERSTLYNWRDYFLWHVALEAALAADRVIVMADGRLIAQGTPREVFSRGRELRANGLDLPPIAMLRDKLIDGGMNIPADVITAEELAEAICPLK